MITTTMAPMIIMMVCITATGEINKNVIYKYQVTKIYKQL